jgi:hypothetical protein
VETVVHFDPIVGARSSPDFVDFFAALVNAEAAVEARLVEAENALIEGEAAIDRSIEAIARVVANDRATAEGGGRLDWGYRIERLQFFEAEAGRDRLRMRKLVDRILSAACDAPPFARRKARALVRRQEDAVARFVEALRDARWQTMALRAQFDPDAATGPVFDDPAELRRFLSDV